MGRERRYPSDLTDAEWAVVEPLLPAPKADGRPEKHPRRDVVDAILYVVRSGCAWRALPADFPPWETVYALFKRWEKHRITYQVLDALRADLRTDQGREADPSAGLMDSQTVRAADTVASDTRGYDAGKKTNGRKRFVITDTGGLLLGVTVRPGSVQDRDGAKAALLDLHHRQHDPTRPGGPAQRRLRHVFVDGGFAGRLLTWARDLLHVTLEVVRKPADQQGFAVIPRRWAVERTLAWLMTHRRLVRDYERLPATSEALIRWASIATMTRRLTRGHPATRPTARPTPTLT